MVQLVRILEGLPEGFETLRVEADAEGFRAMSRLATEWATSPDMFVCLLAAVEGGGLLGIGGLTPEPEPAGEPAMRMRRLYVRQDARRDGVGRTLANALLQEALDSVRLVTVNAATTLAPAFWTTLGFQPVAQRPWSHEFRLPGH
jgi:GNAT superfamily N-acetyltransferase